MNFWMAGHFAPMCRREAQQLLCTASGRQLAGEEQVPHIGGAALIDLGRHPVTVEQQRPAAVQHSSAVQRLHWQPKDDIFSKCNPETVPTPPITLAGMPIRPSSFDVEPIAAALR